MDRWDRMEHVYHGARNSLLENGYPALCVPAVNDTREDLRLRRLTKICLALPEAQREIQGRHARFHVRNRTFAYFLDDHHGDGIVAMTCKVERHDMPAFFERDPTRFYVPDYIGPKGWIALCLDVKPVDWAEVAALVRGSYCRVAPKTLAGRARA
jgi:predicted DNA-binding protein (MmcQ/YjbR family)